MRFNPFLGLCLVAACAACGASPAYEAKTPATVVVVPADRVVDKCPCDGEPEAPPLKKPTEYVHVTEWQSPASAQRTEAFIAQNPDRFRSNGAPPPALTLHSSIPQTTFGRVRYWRYR